MTEHNTPWYVRIKTAAPYGLCAENLPEIHGTERYVPFAVCRHPNSSSGNERHYFEFKWYFGENSDPSAYNSRLTRYMSFDESFRRWAQQRYDLRDDMDWLEDNVNIITDFRRPGNGRRLYPISYEASTTALEQRFETEEEAIEYIESQSVQPFLTFEDGDYLFRVRFTQVIEGIPIQRTVGIQHSGDTVNIYTMPDLENFYANAMDMDTVFHPGGIGEWRDYWIGADCEQRLEATILNLDDFGSSIATVESDIQDIPDSSSITIIDGDPDLTLTEVVNGPGSVTISDDGNIMMINDGGTFFLNEFGNAGFYANGDASLTADNQVQLGSGGTTFNVDSNGLNMRDSTGTVSFTADELSRLKDLLS